MSEQDPKVGRTIKHGAEKPFEFAFGGENIDTIAGHIARWVGPPDNVYHEVISDKVHIDVHIVAPTKARPYYTLVTSGMSDRPMRAPKPELAYAELFLCLPPSWKLSNEDLKSSRYYWPVRALRFLARFPHQFDTWLWHSHTVPNGDPPAPFDTSTNHSSFIILRPTLMPPEFHKLKVSAEKTVHFFAVVPLYADELAVKLQKGAEAIEVALAQNGYSELIDVNRKSAFAPKGFFSRFFGK
jgi:hypothetical protein